MLGSNENKTKLRVATFNIGDFSTASGNAGNNIRYGSGTQKTLEEYIDVFGKVGADLWGLQEDSEFFFYPEKIYPYDALYKKILPNYQRVFAKEYNGKAFLSSLELYDVSTLSYPPAITSYSPEGTSNYGHGWYLTGKIRVGGKEINVVTLHLDWHCRERRAAQLDEIVRFVKSCEYCIVTGDFNPDNYINGQKMFDENNASPDSINMYRVDWKKLDEAGLEYANGGKFGTFGTIMSGGKPADPFPWDNIVVTPNIKILSAEAIYEPWMNDHAIVVADLEIT